MKRSRLVRKTPMKRGRWLAKRRKPMKRTRLKAVSAKQSVLRQLWHEKRDAHLDSHPFCALNLGIKGCPRSKPHKAHDVHHSKGRGRFLLDESTYKSACRTGHNWVHSHTKAARKLGLFNP